MKEVLAESGGISGKASVVSCGDCQSKLIKGNVEMSTFMIRYWAFGFAQVTRGYHLLAQTTTCCHAIISQTHLKPSFKLISNQPEHVIS